MILPNDVKWHDKLKIKNGFYFKVQMKPVKCLPLDKTFLN